MRFLYMMLVSIFMMLSFSSCSKTPEPYYDRAQNASKEAHEQLRKD